MFLIASLGSFLQYSLAYYAALRNAFDHAYTLGGFFIAFSPSCIALPLS